MSTNHIVEKLRAEVGELVARHANARDVQEFSAYRGKPVEFMRAELGFDPYAKQIEVIEAFERDRRIAVRGNHGAGKDAVLAPLMLYAAYCCGMLVLAISATERQLLGQLWREVGNRFSARLPGELYRSDLRINGEPRIIAMTSGSVSNLTGWHDPNGVFIAISEAQGDQVESAAFDAAIANAVDDASRIVVVGNPVKAAGRFYEVSTKETWRSIAISAFDHPNVIEQRVVIAGGPAPAWPAEMAAEFGEESPWYVSRVLGEFPASGSVDSLIQRAWLEAAYDRHSRGDGWLKRAPLPVITLDVARSLERDESVASVVQGPRVHSLTAWRSRDLTTTATRFLEIADRTRCEWARDNPVAAMTLVQSDLSDPANVERCLMFASVPPFKLVCDAPSIGGGVIDWCRSRGRAVVEWWGWLPAADEKRFANQRAAAYWHFRTLLESGVAELPRDAALQEEALAMEWSQDAKGRIVMISKDELRKTIKRSPDRLDACVMGLYAATDGERAPRISFVSVAM